MIEPHKMDTTKEKQTSPGKLKLVRRQNSAVLPEALDGAWGWMVVLGAAINFTVFGLIIRVFGVFYFEFLIRFQSNATTTAWVGAINMALSGLLCEYHFDQYQLDLYEKMGILMVYALF